MASDWKYRYRNEKKKEAHKEFEGWTNQQFIDHILELRSAVTGLEELLKEKSAQTGENAPKKQLSEKEYKQEWSYPTKVAFLLTLSQKPLKSEDLNKLLLKHDKHYKDYNDPMKNLIVTLSRAVKSGRIKKIKVPGVRSLYYALPGWIDKNGMLHDDFSFIFNTFA